MAPEYGATMGFFPIDDETIRYLQGTGRDAELCETVKNYFVAQEMFGIPDKGECDYTDLLELDLASIQPSVSGPKRPQDRIDVPKLRDRFDELFTTAATEGGFGETADLRDTRSPVHLDSPAGEFDSPILEGETITAVDTDTTIGHGSVLIAAITSCTNTSNPSVMLAAGLLAKRANEKGLSIAPYVKTSLAPGSRVVTDYLDATGLTRNWTSSDSRRWAMAAPPALGTPGRCTRQSSRPSRRVISSALPCSPETATSRPACTARSVRTSSCRRPWWWPTPWRAGSIWISAPNRSGTTRMATRCS